MDGERFRRYSFITIVILILLAFAYVTLTIVNGRRQAINNYQHKLNEAVGYVCGGVGIAEFTAVSQDGRRQEWRNNAVNIVNQQGITVAHIGDPNMQQVFDYIVSQCSVTAGLITAANNAQTDGEKLASFTASRRFIEKVRRQASKLMDETYDRAYDTLHEYSQMEMAHRVRHLSLQDFDIIQAQQAMIRGEYDVASVYLSRVTLVLRFVPTSTPIATATAFP
jgi:hypothetical protein